MLLIRVLLNAKIRSRSFLDFICCSFPLPYTVHTYYAIVTIDCKQVALGQPVLQTVH